MIFPLPKVLPLTFLILQVYWWWILSVFVYLWNLHSTSLFERYFQGIDSTLSFFSFSTLKISPPLSFHMHCFWWEMRCFPYLCSSEYICLLSPYLFKIFSLSLLLRSSILIWLGVIFFMFLVLGIHCVFWICGFIVFNQFGKFLALLFQLHMFTRLLEFFHGSLMPCFLGFCLLVYCFNSLSSLCYILDSFYHCLAVY